jgi:hypothetical protein
VGEDISTILTSPTVAAVTATSRSGLQRASKSGDLLLVVHILVVTTRYIPVEVSGYVARNGAESVAMRPQQCVLLGTDSALPQAT